MKPEGSDELSSLTEMLQNEEPIRLQWGAGSRIRIDRELPFLCIHRRSKPEVDGTAALLNSTASSLVVAPGDNPRPLLEKVVETYEPMFGAFFILEVWSKKALGIYPPPQFVIHPGRDPNSMRLAETLAEELARVSGKVPTEIEISNDRPRPTEMGPLLSKAFREEHRVVLLGLEVGALYQDADGKPYPALLRTFRRGLTNRLQKLLFEFSQNFTTYAPPNFQTLGPRAMVKLVWKVDEALEEISRRFSFLLQVTPTNISSAWLAFKRSKFEENPDFIYRPFPHDLTELKRELYAIPMERIEEPTFYHIFQEKQHQLDLKMTMIARRRTPHFLYGSLSLYGKVDQDLSTQASHILDSLPGRARDSDPRLVNAEEFARRAQEEVNSYRRKWDGFCPLVVVREDLETSILCDDGNLLIGTGARVAASRVEPLIHHEVGTHLLTYYNGRAQPLRQLAMGLADYIEFQEGIAVLSEFLSGHVSRPRLRFLAFRVLAVENMIDGADFVENFAQLKANHEIPNRKLFELLARVYRGGGMTKDAVYLRGLLSLLEHLREGGELEALFVGKIARHHIPLIQELQWRGVLKEAPLKPNVLDDPQAARRLETLKAGPGLEPLLRPSETYGRSKG